MKENAEALYGKYTLHELKEISRKIRIDILKMLHKAKSGHTGGSLSAVEILVSLYYVVMRHRPDDPMWEDRDRFVLSKGHAAPALYAVLASCGYFPREELNTLRQLGSRLQGHPKANSLPGIEVSTGSLGQGLSIANGIALGLRLSKKDSRVYVLLGDGEIQEGMVWEAAMSASHYSIDNLCAIVDNNGFQIDGAVHSVMNIYPIGEKFSAFGWQVFEVNGHDFVELLDAFNEARHVKGRPSIIIAKTVKGKGVSFMEGKYEYHGVAPTDDELVRALKELGES